VGQSEVGMCGGGVERGRGGGFRGTSNERAKEKESVLTRFDVIARIKANKRKVKRSLGSARAKRRELWDDTDWKRAISHHAEIKREEWEARRWQIAEGSEGSGKNHKGRELVGVGSSWRAVE